MRRFFLDKCCLNNNIITITEEEHNHLAYVLRMRVGEDICVCFNDGMEYISTIQSITKTTSACLVNKIQKSVNETQKEVVLFQDLIKQDNFELVVQKATELGVKKIVPFYSDFSQIKPEKFNILRAQKIAKEASKQCERACIPTIEKPISFNEVISQIQNYDVKIVALERIGNKNINYDIKKDLSSYALIVGCEGGFSEKEKETLLNSSITAITLGKRILKAETASIVSLALIMNLIGELN